MADTEFDPSAIPGTAEHDHRASAVSTIPEIAEIIPDGMEEAPEVVVEAEPEPQPQPEPEPEPEAEPEAAAEPDPFGQTGEEF